MADRDTLLSLIARQFDSVHDFRATVDMIPAFRSAEKSEIKNMRASICFRKPSDIRIIELNPAVRHQSFDMASNGVTFELYVPARNQFITGRNRVDRPSTNKIENLRPQHFLEALLVRPISLETSKVLVENFTDENHAYYLLHEVHVNGGGHLQLTRTIWIDRLDLTVTREMVFDPAGDVLSEARYSEWKSSDNVAFPRHIEIRRPGDECSVIIDLVRMDINYGVPDNQFALEQPTGSTLEVIGSSAESQPPN